MKTELVRHMVAEFQLPDPWNRHKRSINHIVSRNAKKRFISPTLHIIVRDSRIPHSHWILTRWNCCHKIKSTLFYSHFLLRNISHKFPKMTDRQVNTDFNRVASLLGCSVCLDMCASGRVLQCKNGHNICGVHIAQLASCPVCRDRYVGGPSRNLVAEAMVAIHRGVGVEDAGGHGAELPNR